MAKYTCSRLKISIPCLVDSMDDRVNTAYSAWPDRLYIVDAKGQIALAGGRGPRGFAPSLKAAEMWLANYTPPISK